MRVAASKDSPTSLTCTVRSVGAAAVAWDSFPIETILACANAFLAVSRKAVMVVWPRSPSQGNPHAVCSMVALRRLSSKASLTEMGIRRIGSSSNSKRGIRNWLHAMDVRRTIPKSKPMTMSAGRERILLPYPNGGVDATGQSTALSLTPGECTQEDIESRYFLLGIQFAAGFYRKIEREVAVPERSG